MGSLFSKPLQMLWRNRDGTNKGRVLVVGVDGAGKSTMFYKINRTEMVVTIPTIGWTIETTRYQGFELTAWDIGGCQKLRAVWKTHYEGTRGIILMVDSSDRERLQEASRDLNQMLAGSHLSLCPLLVFANKQDRSNPMSDDELVHGLGLYSLPVRKWKIQSCIAKNGSGLREGLGWLISQMRTPDDDGVSETEKPLLEEKVSAH